jgi:acyl-CoA synthetase (AMP-forming)/AMP-acid ligase II
VHVVCDPAPRHGTALADVLAREPVAPTPPERDAAAVSELIFTSGTEATPKAIMHTEQTTNFSVCVAAVDMQIDSDDVVRMPSPLGRSTGFNYGLRFALYHGLPLILQDRWDAAVAVDVVRREHCSYTLAATTFLRELVAEPVRRGERLDSLRCFGAAARPCRRRWSKAPRRMVSACSASTARPALVATWNRPAAPLAARVNTDGTPMTGVDVELRDGEIFVRGPNTCVGFFADRERTATTFDADGWVRSGDLASLDAEHNLTIVGRKKELIIRGGMNITPRELEVVCACVVLLPGAGLELATVVAAPAFWAPRRVVLAP